MSALREPSITISTRCPRVHIPPPRVVPSPKRNATTSSKIIAALDAKVGESVNESENIGPVVLGNAASNPRFGVEGGMGVSTAVNTRENVRSTVSATNAGIISKRSNSVRTSRSNSSKGMQAKPSTDTNLPVYSYRDFSSIVTTVYTRHEEEANDLVQALRGPLGFDMEWRVLFRAKAIERPTALVQLSDERMILLIQVSAMKRFPEKLKEVIESKDIVKMGANILNDGSKLFKDFGVVARNLVELGALAQQADPEFAQALGSTRSIVALAKVVERYCARRLAKGKERMGNWEAELGREMIDYAANDAHCALMVYKRLLTVASENGRTLEAAKYTSAVTIPSTRPVTTAQSTEETPMRPQYIRAYQYWHKENMPLDRICAKLRSEDEPLKESTVISYVVSALKSDPSLPFEMGRLKALVQMEAGSWRRHCEWILEAEME